MKIFRFSALLFFTVALASFWTAMQTYAQQSYNPTVKIVSYVYTKNDGVLGEVSGSGTLINSTGLILTNNHVVERDETETYDVFGVCITSDVNAEPECEYGAHLVARNRQMDVALIQMHETDIRGNALPTLPFLSYTQCQNLAEEDAVSIMGYPGIGLDTITFTNGTVSGFEQLNGFRYIKTDTTIAPGNSGGTALDAAGNFCGIPTYGISSIGSSLGYFLDINAALEWITANIDAPLQRVPNAIERLSEQLARINDAKESRDYIYPHYPSFTLSIPENWEFERLSRSRVTIASEDKIKPFEVRFTFQEVPFEITAEYLEEAIFKKLERNKNQYQDYTRTETEFRGVPAHLVTHVYFDKKSYNYIIPYGNVLIFAIYEINLKDQAEDLAVYDEVLENFRFLDEPRAPNPPQKVVRNNPPFSLQSVGAWKIQLNHDPREEDTILQVLRQDDVDAALIISHHKLSESQKQLSNEDFLQNILDNHHGVEDFRLIAKNDTVFVDGLPGVSLTYSYRGEELGKDHTMSKVYLRDVDDYYFIRFDSLSTDYSSYLPDVKTMLRSFKNLAENAPSSGRYTLGSLSAVFADISYHRFEEAIATLKDDGIIEGYADGTFRPEKPVSRAEALKIMFAAKIVSDEKQDDTTLAEALETFADEQYAELDFPDIADMEWFLKYARYARENNTVQGYTDNMFHPNVTVALAEACKMLFGIYDIPVWNPEQEISKKGVAWTKPYMDTAIELDIIPRGMYDPAHQLTRAELSYIIARFLEQVEK